MWSGTAALKNIDQSLQTIRNEVVRLDTQLSQLSESLAADKRHRVKLIKDIAAVRLEEIASGELAANLNAADLQAAEFLAQRDTALAALELEIEATNTKIAEAEQKRDDMLTLLNQKSQAVVDVEASVQTSLQNDQAYLAQLELARDAESVSAEAERKVEQAQSDMAEKAEPYQDDDLFMYLWNRGYGTTEYKGGLFARFMDGRVASIIKYEPARVNYWNLTEIPQRLSEHADRVAELADEQHMALQQLELDALEGAGVRAIETELEQLRKNLDAHDDTLEQFETQLNEHLARRANFVTGDDDYTQRCLSRLTQALDHQDLREVYQYVRDTHSPTDDQLLLELQSLDDRSDDVDDDLRDVRNLHDAKLNKLKELEEVRRQFKNSRYDDVRSGFGNQALITSVLGQFLQGVVSGSDVWRTIKRNQRYRNVGSIPDFGSDGLGDLADIFGGSAGTDWGSVLGGGSLGGVGGQRGRRTNGRTNKNNRRPRARRKSTWNWPQPRRGGGGFKIPRGGGGGFKTGGGF